MVAQWNVLVFKEILLSLGFNVIRKIAAKPSLGKVSYSWLNQRFGDEPSVVQPSASVDRIDQWWDLSQSPVSARTPNLIDED